MQERPDWAGTTRTVVTVGVLLLTLAALTVSDTHLGQFSAATKLDLRFGYAYADVVALFDEYGTGGRRAYAVNLGVDTVYPIALAAASVLLATRAFGARRRVLWVPALVFAVLDVLENALFGVALATHPEVPAGPVAVASVVTRVKLGAFPLAVAVILVAGGVLAFRWVRGRRAGP